MVHTHRGRGAQRGREGGAHTQRDTHKQTNNQTTDCDFFRVQIGPAPPKRPTTTKNGQFRSSNSVAHAKAYDDGGCNYFIPFFVLSACSLGKVKYIVRQNAVPSTVLST